MFIIILIVCFVYALMNYTIFEITRDMNQRFEFDEDGVYLLDYVYSTGSGWYIKDCSDESLINKEIVLYNLFDPRFLKANKDFELDYFAQYIVTGKLAGYDNVDNERIPILQATNITVIYNTEDENYKIRDMSLQGMIKSLLGVILPKYRFSK